MAELDVTRIVRSARTNLRRRLARRPIAFVLSGGGSQGSFEVGVLRYLYDDLSVRPAILVGSSVGAIIAAKLAEGDDEESGTPRDRRARGHLARPRVELGHVAHRALARQAPVAGHVGVGAARPGR